MKTINCNGKLIDLSSPKVMGILNITPDSFYDGGKYNTETTIVNHVEKMLSEGATFIDVGAYSSRPGAQHISEIEEKERIEPVIKLLIREFPKILISVDTFRSEVATLCLHNGCCVINDISAGNMDKNMFDTVAKFQAPYIMTHMQGTPQNMDENPAYNDVVKDLLFYFSEKIYELRSKGVNDLIADVGFGFGKTLEHNYQLLSHLELFKDLNIPVLAGLSRKSMLFKPLKINQSIALNATTAANTIALLKGANLLRVHDVNEAVEAIKIIELLHKNE
jgi:dihydropteroate synthase